MMAGQIGYGLFAGIAILLAVGAAFGQGKQTFASKQAAQRHCPADAVVWLNTSSYYGHTQRGTYVCKAEADKTACAHGQVQNERFWQIALADLRLVSRVISLTS
jgi:hypothetical protein